MKKLSLILSELLLERREIYCLLSQKQEATRLPGGMNLLFSILVEAFRLSIPSFPDSAGILPLKSGFTWAASRLRSDVTVLQ